MFGDFCVEQANFERVYQTCPIASCRPSWNTVAPGWRITSHAYPCTENALCCRNGLTCRVTCFFDPITTYSDRNMTNLTWLFFEETWQRWLKRGHQASAGDDSFPQRPKHAMVAVFVFGRSPLPPMASSIELRPTRRTWRLRMVVSSVSTSFNHFQATNLQPKRKKGMAPVSGGVEKAGHFRITQLMRISVTYYINLDDIAGALYGKAFSWRSLVGWGQLPQSRWPCPLGRWPGRQA